jgi:hypothetical protein
MGALTACLSLFLAASLRRPDASSLESVCMYCGVFYNVIICLGLCISLSY